MASAITSSLNRYMAAVGEQVSFAAQFGRNIFRDGFEWNEFLHQCYVVGVRSVSLVAISGFVIGFVLTLQTQPTMKQFGAESFVPGMVAISIVREIGPMIIALICTGKIASSIGAELGSMKVTEQIDAMEVSSANPIQYLVVTRILACTLMVPLLTVMADALAFVGGWLGVNTQEHVSGTLFFRKAFAALEFSDLIPAVIKTFFFGFAIGFVGCYKGYHASRGTESVGLAANSAVVTASLWIILLDAVAVQITNLLYY
ncbi:ABC transporter permease [Chitinophaga sp.]|uniref:MlaE family ABC transporter permease n=1 Tax=Chitinophaga sp. TaxID=1869181 RepID=UPI0031D9CD09